MRIGAGYLLCAGRFSKDIFGSFEIGLELLIINGALTFFGLMAVSKKKTAPGQTI